MSLYASWVHGNSVLLERHNAPAAKDKSGVLSSFLRSDGDLVRHPNRLGVACLRIGWAARFVVWDLKTFRDTPRSGSFWCHYAVPTPVLEAGRRAKADLVLINYESSDINALSLAAVHVWDGNRRIFADDSPVISGDDFNGGISGHTNSAGATPDLDQLWRGDIGSRPIYFGVSVSLSIRAQEAKDDYLEIRGVGVDFQIE